jgi:Rieske Fe-S protein
MASESQESPAEVSRRAVLRGAAVSGVALPLLAACGGSSDSSSSASGGSADDPSAQSDGSAGATVPAGDVPEGGGTVVKADKIVVTQPTKGDFKAFTAVCTHQGCLVSEIKDGQIHCPCHGSVFSIQDGSVLGGPAPSPLAEKKVSVSGNQISVT